VNRKTWRWPDDKTAAGDDRQQAKAKTTKNSKNDRRKNKEKTKSPLDEVGSMFRNGALGRIRTCDHLVRSQVLYPTELQVRMQ
jgi:hypothetical protein